MQRRSRAGGKPVKARRRKTTKPSRNTLKVAAPRSSSDHGHELEIARLTRELKEALEQQTAASEVLRVISSSPGELDSVFQAMLANATRICEAKCGTLFLPEGNAFRAVAQHGAPRAWAEVRRREPVIRPGPKNPLARVASQKQVEHITDLRIDEAYIGGRSRAPRARRSGWSTN